ncbi:MAG TPA: proton-conducting transporter membrane subunit [Methylomirabilota bacterium]|jgi:hydrogenase-4 component B|nr:proton-conducting transporter membrane subunit [Methylomirabilota bacterium]
MIAVGLYALAALAGLAGAILGLAGMLGRVWSLRVDAVVPLGGLELTMDPLAGLFIAVAGAATVATSLTAAGGGDETRRGAGTYLLFVAAMGVVPLAANAITFLIAWELMSLASWALVLDRRDDDARHAAWVYAVMTHAGLACLIAGMLLLATHTGSVRFEDWRAAAPALQPAVRAGAALLLGLGFASKAGVIPLHVWLPLAHPAAPSHVSALMSGVMVKLGVLGLVRVGVDWLGPAPVAWGTLILLAGALSALAGILHALVETDLKRLLAFSTIENVGIVLIGLGAAMLFRHAQLETLARLALVAALYHVLNHAMFKTLLFLAAGVVVHGVGTHDLEAMGGLIKRMPWTAAAFLLGALAIAGLPPLNGFVSEWLTFQALLQNVALEAPALNLVFALAAAALALTAGLGAACFTKAFGIAFLALPRSEAAAHAHEASGVVRTVLLALAGLCVLLGIGPTVVVPALGRVAGPLVGADASGGWGGALTLTVGSFAGLSTIAIAAALLVGLAVPGAALAWTGIARRRYDATWGCGRLRQTARMEYTATAFADPFTRVFNFFYRPRTRLDRDVHPQSRLFVRRIAYTSPTRSIFDEWLYRPALDSLRVTIERVQRLQSGRASTYLVYIFAALLALLVLR